MKKYLFFAASAALMLASCSNEVEFTQQDLQNAAAENALTPVQFGTYLGHQSVTRAGYEGSINTDRLKDFNTSGVYSSKGVTKGFGVFGYYTGTATYNGKNGAYNASGKIAPNFMFNEQVYWDNDNSVWKYDNIKYWPNEVASGAVDDQNNDSGSDPATTTNANGGNVTFFAYSPYVGYSDGNLNGGTGLEDGITAINGANTLAAGNTVTGDPTITYVIPKDGQIVDLLWGTFGDQTGKNVLGTGNTGATSTAGSVQYNPVTNRSTYEEDILKDYTTLADLTKQKTDGTVNIVFKHALSKIGGSKKNASNEILNTSGLMVVLDIDGDNGAESGGTKSANTVVTIESIQIESALVSYTNDNGSNWSNGWIKGGVFNLATGKWTLTTGTLSDKVTQLITSASTDTGSDAVLATSIAEPTGAATMVSGYKVKGTVNGIANIEVEGVTTTKKNVYSDEANPFVFIPGTKPAFDITVTYYVRTFDSNLANTSPELGKSGETGTWTNVKQVIKKHVQFDQAVELNKMYSLLMHLGLTSVKFTASVSDWVVDGDTNGNGEIDGDEVGITETYLPINVQNATTALSIALGNNAAVNTPNDNTSYAITLTGLTSANSFTAEVVASGGDAATIDATSGAFGGDSKMFTVTLPANDNNARTYTVTITDTTADPHKVTKVTIYRPATPAP